MFVYALALVDGKFFVGKTLNPKFRLDLCFASNFMAPAWVKMYPPIKVLEMIDGDSIDENKHTLKYMKNFGIDNVRGGSYSEVTFSDETRSLLEKSLLFVTIDEKGSNLIPPPPSFCFDFLYDAKEEFVYPCHRCDQIFDTKEEAEYHEIGYKGTDRLCRGDYYLTN